VKESRRDSPGLWCSIRSLPDNRTIVYNGDWANYLQDTETGETKGFSVSEKTDVRRYPIALTPDGATLISGEQDAKLKVWDLTFPR
jgi:hypothetical protein